MTSIVLLCVAASSIVALLRFPFTLDDAFITFRYARNFAQGYPLGTWNVGEVPVEGFSSLLWTLILAAGIKLGLSPLLLSKCIGYLSAAALPCVTLLASSSTGANSREKGLDATTLRCASVMLSLYFPLFYYSVTGMEATFFALQVLLLLLIPVLSPGPIRGLCAALISMALVLTRPEGIFIAGFVNGYGLFSAGRRWPRSWACIGLVATAVTFLGLTAFRLHQFGEIMPNTYFAKATGGSAIHRAYLGIRYLVQFLLLVAPAAVALAYSAIRGRRRIFSDSLLIMLLLLCGIYTLYVVKVGGDPNAAFPLRRHFVHSIAAFALLAGTIIAMKSENATKAVRFSLITSLLTACWMGTIWGSPLLKEGLLLAVHAGPLQLAPPPLPIAWYGRYSAPQTVIALSTAGQQPWYIPGRYIDMLALNDAHIAKYGHVDSRSKMLDTKTDMAYVLGRHPDIIVGYLQAHSMLENQCPGELHGDRSMMMHDMVSNPGFQHDYVFIVNGPYPEDTNAVFFSKDYLKHLGAPELQGVSVDQTVLGHLDCR